jgi:hypothetical protein
MVKTAPPIRVRIADRFALLILLIAGPACHLPPASWGVSRGVCSDQSRQYDYDSDVSAAVEPGGAQYRRTRAVMALVTVRPALGLARLSA